MARVRASITAGATENNIYFYPAGGHSHDGQNSSLIDTTQYSVYDFNFGYISDNPVRRQFQINSFESLKQVIKDTVTDAVLTPAGIVLQPNTLNGATIIARTIEAGQIVANSITANEIAANTITADEIAANTITASKIAANTITANEIAANAITASEIAAGVISADKLVSNIILVNNTIRSNNYSAGSAGWIINNTGSAEFNNVTVRGTIAATSGNIAGWTINTSNITGGSTILYSNGYIDATNGSFTGTITATGGSITGRLSVATVNDIQIGKNINDAANHDGIRINNLFAGGWGNAWVKRGDNSVYYRVGNDDTFIQVDTSGTNQLTFKNVIDVYTTCSTNIYTNAQIRIDYISTFAPQTYGITVCTLSGSYIGAILVESSGLGGSFSRFYTSSGVVNPSDSRLKNIYDENINCLEIINNINVTKYSFKNDPQNKKYFGFIAQDVYNAVPEAITIGGDDEKTNPWMINESILIPYAIAGVKQLYNKIKELEDRIKILEGV